MIKVSFYRYLEHEEYEAIRYEAIRILKKVKQKYPFTKFRERIICDRLIKTIKKDASYMGEPWIDIDEIVDLKRIKPLKDDAIEDGEVVLCINTNKLYEFDFEPALYIKLKEERIYDTTLKSLKNMIAYTSEGIRCYMRLWPNDHEIRNFIVSNHIIECNTRWKRWNLILGDFIIIEPLKGDK